MKFAMLFPGHGSQKVGMINCLSKNFSTIKKTFYEASDYINYNLWNAVNTSSMEKLNNNKYISAIILTTSVSIYRIWKIKNGEDPNFAAGHSLGEYSALVCSQSISFKDGLNLVIQRHRLMQIESKKNPGSMMAIIGTKQKIIKKICKNLSNKKKVFISSINSKSEIVISGNKQSMDIVGKECKKYGAKAFFKLSVDIPYHCILMKSASIKLIKILKNINFKKPIFPIINNVDAKCEKSEKKIKTALIKQLINPVNWKKSINLIISNNIFLILEVGTGNILTNINKNLKQIHTVPLNNKINFIYADQKVKMTEKLYEEK